MLSYLTWTHWQLSVCVFQVGPLKRNPTNGFLDLVSNLTKVSKSFDSVFSTKRLKKCLNHQSIYKKYLLNIRGLQKNILSRVPITFTIFTMFGIRKQSVHFFNFTTDKRDIYRLQEKIFRLLKVELSCQKIQVQQYYTLAK